MHIGRKLLTFVALILCATPILAEPPTAAQTSFWACPRTFQGQTLNVYNWTTYIAEDTISNFERLCGVTVQYDTYGSDGEMLDVIRAGNEPGYDIVVPSNSTVNLMIEEDLLLSLDMSEIPNYDNLGEGFRNPLYDPDNRYTVTYQWGSIGVGYNRTKVGRDITSWEDVFTYTGNVAWLDEYRPMLSFALILLGHDPNTTDQGEIQEAVDYLIANGGNVVEIAPDTGQDLLEAGTVDIAIEFSGDIYQLIANCNCDDYRYVIPWQGSQIWSDNLAIPQGAHNSRLAHVFIDYILNAQVGADISNFTAYASPNQTAIDEGLISYEYLNDPAIYLPEALIAKLFYNVSSTELEALYTPAWEQVIAAVPTQR